MMHGCCCCCCLLLVAVDVRIQALYNIHGTFALSCHVHILLCNTMVLEFKTEEVLVNISTPPRLFCQHLVACTYGSEHSMSG